MAEVNLINVATIIPSNIGFNLTNATNSKLITPATDKVIKINTITVANVDETNDATIDIAISGSANFNTRRYLLKTVLVPADSTTVIEKPINLGAGDKLETQANANSDLDVFASILEIT